MLDNFQKINEKQKLAGERTVVLQDPTLRKLEGFVQIPRFILKHPTLSFGARVTYSILLSYAWQEEFCFPAQEAIAKDLNCSVRQIQRLLTELKAAGFISWKQQGLNRPNTYYLLPLKTELSPKTPKTKDTTYLSGLDATNMSHKLESIEVYTKPLTVRNGDKKIFNNPSKNKNKFSALPKLDQPIEKTQYLANEILRQLKDTHSLRFYHLVASRVPESVIRQTLSEIKADGAHESAKVFTYRMKLYAKERSLNGSL